MAQKKSRLQALHFYEQFMLSVGNWKLTCVPHCALCGWVGSHCGWRLFLASGQQLFNVQMFKCNCSCSEAFLHKQLLCKRTELGEMHHLYQFCSVVKRSLVRFQATDSYSEKPLIWFRWKHNKGQLCYSCPYLWVSFHWWTCSQEVQTLDSWLEQVRTDAQIVCFLTLSVWINE